jgi:predicted enzyme related to lactoylglutathione lyase
MAASAHGTPCWYELGTDDLDDVVAFYGPIFGWTFQRSTSVDMDYRLAAAGQTMVAGFMSNQQQGGSPPPACIFYVAVNDCDATSAQATALGAKAIVPPSDIPGTGRFAVLMDPQGAVFGLLSPRPMENGAGWGGAFNAEAAGHGAWHELMTTHPDQAFDFYATLLGWGKSAALDMGTMGTYQLFSHNGSDIGGIMGQANAPRPCWLPYFRVDDVPLAMERIRQGGGTVLTGPMEVPGPGWIAVALDPRQAAFAVVGPKIGGPT